MSTDTRPMPAFGKRASEEAWARAQRDRRELTICPWRFSAWLTGLVSGAFLLLLDAVRLLAGGAEGLGPVAEAASWLTGGPGVLAGVIVLVPVALLAQCASALVGIGLSGEPLVAVGPVGITVHSRRGNVVMAWEEVDRIGFPPGAALLHRKRRAVPRLCNGPAYARQRAYALLVLVGGGADALRQAITEVRPDVARRLDL